MRLDQRNQKTIYLFSTKTISLKVQIDKIVYRLDLQTTIPASFLSQSLNHTAIKLLLKKVSTLTIANFKISTSTDVMLQKNVKHLRAIRMCRSSTPEYGYDNSIINVIGDVYCRNTECFRVSFACTKRLFNLSAEAIVNVCNARPCGRCEVFLLKIKKTRFLLFPQRVYNFEGCLKSIQYYNGNVYCPGKYYFNRNKWESLDFYETSPRFIHGCGRCGAWLFAHKVPFTLHEQLMTSKLQTRRIFSLLERDEIGTPQTIVTYCPFSVN